MYVCYTLIYKLLNLSFIFIILIYYLINLLITIHINNVIINITCMHFYIIYLVIINNLFTCLHVCLFI